MPKPFIRWVGGKAQSLRSLRSHVPLNFNRYYEPFVGGGAFFFSMMPKDAFLSDVNKELMITYEVLRDDVEALMRLLREYPNTEEFFKELRATDLDPLTRLETAARFIYLNKTCFNGLYRVNQKGQFNAPYNKTNKANICDRAVLTVCSKALQGVKLMSGRFNQAITKADKGDFIYLDPPYMPVKSDSFTAYSDKGFQQPEHEELAGWFDELTKFGVQIMMSNSDVPWVRERYEQYKIIEIMAKRSVNSKGSGRGPVQELLIKNY